MIYKEDLEKIREAKKKDGTLFLVKKIPNSIYWRSRNRLVGARLSKRQTRLYNSWIKKYELSEFKELKYKPKLSVLVPVYNVKSVWLNKCIESVLSQNYENWELCLYDDASTMAETIQTLHEWEGRDRRIKISFGKVNQHISGASNRCLAMATGDFVALLDNDDELTQNALYEAAKVLNDNLALDFIYSDEDKIDEEGTRKDPYFKPDWAPELFLSQMYTCHLGVYRRSIMEKINGFRVGYEGSQDYDLVLRFIEQTNPQKICHIPKILYHWRTLKTSTASSGKAKTYTLDAGRKTLTNYLERNKIQGKVELGLSSNTYHVINNIVGHPLVSVIIPFRDKGDLLNCCVDSILDKTTYDNYEIILVNNDSKENETKKLLIRLSKNKKIKILDYNKEFNFSAINNWASERVQGEYLLFLNNDTEVINGNWLEAMLGQAQRKGVGAVGAKLLYSDNRTQHAGVVMGLGIAGHAFKHLQDDEPGYFSRASSISNYTAVTGACLLIDKKLFQKMDGFNETELGIAYNDIDLCLRLIESGYRNVYTPYAKLYHYESVSRGYENPETIKKDHARYNRVISEMNYMKEKWEKYIDNDPLYSPNLTREKEDFSIRE